MISTTIILIFAICLIGCSIQSWRIGNRNGIENTIMYLASEGIIELDDEDEIEV